MRTIKMDVNSLEKAYEVNENQGYLREITEMKKKLQQDKRSKVIENETSPYESIDAMVHRLMPSDDGLEKYRQTSNFKEKNITIFEQQKGSKTSVKLPTINVRALGRGVTETTQPINDPPGIEEPDYVVEHVDNSKSEGANLSRKNNRASLKENKLQDNIGSDKVGSFLKYIQIKSMKPSEKSPTRPIDLSVRDLKLGKTEKMGNPFIVVSRATEIQSIKKPKIERKSSQKSALRKVEDKEKTSINYSIRKEKKVLSITQPVKKKVSNTYYDFCFYVCLLNRMLRPGTPVGNYRAYVGKGNNSILIKNSLKNRFWWNIVDMDNEVNLHWTQARDSKFLMTLKSYDSKKFEKQEDEKKEMKKVEFYLGKDSERQEMLKQYTGVGLSKLLSREEKRKFGKTLNSVELPCEDNYRKIDHPNKMRMHNHLENHWHISNKKALYYNLKKYYESVKEDPFVYIPLTFHVQKEGDQEWLNFEKVYNGRAEEIAKKSENKKKKKEKNMWIVKPGENSNQGCGIQVHDNIDDIREMIKNREERSNGKARSLIIQKYVMPFLYNKRKFDIRCYVLVTSVNSIIKAYWYEQGYIRTCSKEFTIKNLRNRFIHLTNDAVQKKSEDYGKFENGNKISFQDFQKYLDNTYPEKEYKFFSHIYPNMMKRASDLLKSACMLMDPNNREFSFEIFGLDYMIDEDFDVWLIEVNTNPCLELSSPLLARIIPNMIENSLKIAIDPIFPPPREYPKTKTMPSDLFDTNKFTLIFNSSEEQETLTRLTKDTNLSGIIESDEEEDNFDEIQ